jgi:hypothetical protein
VALVSLPPTSLPVTGVLDQVVSSTGVTYRRLPAWTRAQVVEPMLDLAATMPSGGRLAFRTASSVLELDVQLTGIRVGDLPERHPAFDLVVDDVVVATHLVEDHMTFHVVGPKPEDLTLLPGGPATVRIDLPGDPERLVEVWLPHAAVLEVQGARVDEGTSLEPADLGRPRWVHHGSSISHCLEAERPTETWPAIAARLAALDLMSIGLGGQCMLDQHVARTMRDEPADLLSLKVGINVVNADSMRERTFRPALHGFLDTVRDGHPETPLLVVTPIICPPAEDHPGPTVLRTDGRVGVVPRSEELSTGSLTLRRVRELVTEVVTSRQVGDPHLHLLDGLQLFGEADLAMLPDALHPDAAGYRLMGERFHALALQPLLQRV